MKMQIKIVAPVFIALLILWAQPTFAGLAAALCQDQYKITEITEETCKGLLVGTIDTIQEYGDYCPDGHTSYGYIISTWHRLLEKKPKFKKIPTALSVRVAIKELGLSCQNDNK